MNEFEFAVQLIATLRKLNVRLEIDEGTLRVHAAKGAISSDLAEQIKLHKSFLIELLDGAAQTAHSSIPKADRNQVMPLFHSQQRLWFIEYLNAAGTAYNVPCAAEFKGDLEIDALKKALKAIVKRHEILRTRFVERGGVPYQQISQESRIDFDEMDCQHWTERELNTQLRVEAERSFDLGEDALLRTRVFRNTEHTSVLLFVFHHIIVDGWSLDIFLRELSTCYLQFIHGENVPSLPQLPIQYADYAVWQNSTEQQSALQSQLVYWKHQLADTPSECGLPLDYPRAAQQQYVGRALSFSIDKTRLHELEILAKQNNVTLYMLCMTAFAMLVGFYNGKDDILVGTPVANRTHKEIEPLIGFFVNTLVIRSKLDPKITVEKLLQNTKKTMLDAFANQALPFEKLVDELQPERALSHSPLFQILFTFQNKQSISRANADSPFTLVEPENFTVKFDLDVSLTQVDQALEGRVQYCSALFKEKTVRQFIRLYTDLLSNLHQYMNTPLANCPILCSVERQRVLKISTGRTKEVAFANVVQLFERSVSHHAQAVALSMHESQWTYDELNADVNVLANALISRGVCPGDRVGIFFERSPIMVVAILAVLKSGASYVPLDPKLPAERVQYMIETASPKLVLTQESSVRFSNNLMVVSAKEILAADKRDESNPHCLIDPGQAAYIIFTSGSTGTPKGIALTHLALGNLLLWQQQSLPSYPGLCTLQFASINFDVSFQELFSTWQLGGEVVVADDEQRLDTNQLLQILQEKKITRCFLPVVAFKYLTKLCNQNELALSDLKEIITAGEALELTTDIRQFLQAHKHCHLHNHYGPAETHVVTAHTITRAEQELRFPAVGKPISNTACYVLDKQLRLLPQGVPGELYIGGDALAQGYFARPDLTAERFIPNSFVGDGARLYKTGDLACFDDQGELFVLGRADHQLKIRGFRVEPGEIENCLKSLEAVKDAIVGSRKNALDEWEIIVWCVTQQSVTSEDIIGKVQGKLPGYMVPATIVCLSEWPLTVSGKIDRIALNENLADRTQSEKSFIAPESATEKTVGIIWAELLNKDAIGRSDNFFELGGHSLLATQMYARIEQAFQCRPKLSVIFEMPTLFGFCAHLDGMRSEKPESIPVISRSEKLKASYNQQRLYFLSKFENSSAIFNMPMVFKLSGRLDEDRLQFALNQVVKKHEILRSSFYESEDELYVTINDGLCISIEKQYKEQSNLANTSEITTLVAESINVEFCLQQAPLLKAVLIHIAPDEQVLIIVVHHILFDGWSSSIFFNDLASYYLNPTLTHMPEPGIQFYDYAAYQRRCIEDGAYNSQLIYWSQVLQDSSEFIAIPSSLQRPHQIGSRGNKFNLVLEHDLKQSLLAIAREQGCSIYMLLMAIFYLVLRISSNETDINIGTASSNRASDQLQNLIGFFANIWVMRIRGNDATTFNDLMMQAKKNLLAAESANDVPFDMVVDHVNPARFSNRSPVYQVMFLLHNAPVQAVHENDLRIEAMDIDFDTATHDLSMHLWDQDQGINGWLEYNTCVFTLRDIENFAAMYKTACQALVLQPDARLNQLSDALNASTWEDRLVQSGFEKALDAVSVDYHWPKEGMRLSIRNAFGEVRRLNCRGQLTLVIKHEYLAEYVKRLNIRVLPILFEDEPNQETHFDLQESGYLNADGDMIRSVGLQTFAVNHGQLTDFCELKDNIGHMSGVKQCLVLVNNAEPAETRKAFLAIVPEEGVDAIDLRWKISLFFVEKKLDPQLMMLSGLPKTSSGTTDYVKLRSLYLLHKNQVSKAGLNEGDHLLFSEKRTNCLTQVIQVDSAIERSSVLNNIHLSTSSTESLPAYVKGDLFVQSSDRPTDFANALRRTAVNHPDKGIFFYHENGNDEFLSYPTLLADAEKLFVKLASENIHLGDVCILVFDDIKTRLQYFWACVLGGIIPINIAYPSEFSKSSGIIKKIRDAALAVGKPYVLTDRHLGTFLQSLQAEGYLSCERVCTNLELNNDAAPFEFPTFDDGALLFFQLSSGSTGIPKVIQEKHRSVLQHIYSIQQFLGYTEKDVSVNWLPHDHVVPILTSHLRDVVLGINQVQIPAEIVLSRPLVWLDVMHKYRATMTWAPNFAFNLLADAIVANSGETWDLSDVRFVLNAGEQVSADTQLRLIQLLEPHGFNGSSLQPSFGMAETSTLISYVKAYNAEMDVFCAAKDSFKHELVRTEWSDPSSTKFVNLGKPLPGVEIRIADSNNQLLVERVIGRLQVRSDVVTQGYFNNQKENSTAFVGDGWFNTGDIGFIDSGNLYLTGREKEQIVINGVNYYCYEIEEVVSGIDGVAATFVAAVGINNPAKGTEELALFFVPENEAATDHSALIRSVRHTLASQYGISAGRVYTLEKINFPKTTSGKIQRVSLKKMLEAQLADSISDSTLTNAPIPVPRALMQKSRTSVQIQTNNGQRFPTLLISDNPAWLKLIGAQRRDILLYYLECDEAHFELKRSSDVLHEPIRLNDFTNYIQNKHPKLGGIILLLEQQDVAQSLFRAAHILNVLNRDYYVKRRNVCLIGTQNSVMDNCWPGFIRSVQKEFANLKLQSVSISSKKLTRTIDCALDEMSASIFESEVFYEKEQRFVQSLVELHLPNQHTLGTAIKKGSHCLVIGGLGGIGYEISKYLIEVYDAHLTIIGRSPIDEDDHSSPQSERLSTLRRLGTMIDYAATDICDVGAMSRLVAAHAKEDKLFDVVFNLAGSYTEASSFEQSPETISQIIDAKLVGVNNIYAALKPYYIQSEYKPIIVNFSSIFAHIGMARISAYSVANALLEAQSVKISEEGLFDSYVYAWPSWQQTGMSADITQSSWHLSNGIQCLSTRQALLFLDILLANKIETAVIGLDPAHPLYAAQRNKSDFILEPIVARTTCDTSNVVTSVQFNGNQAEQHSIPVVYADANFFQELEQMGEVSSLIRKLEKSRVGHRERAPSNDIERQLCTIWSHVLHQEINDVASSFFELGGSSVNAIALAGRISKEYGCDFAVSLIFTCNTVSQQARWLADRQLETSHLPLVYMNADKVQSKVLYLIHPGGGAVFCYNQLASLIESDVLVVALQAPGLSENEEVLGSMQEMVNLYAASIYNAQSEKACYIGGWSAGGLIAYEVASQLQKIGGQVEKLVIIDVAPTLLEKQERENAHSYDEMSLMFSYAPELQARQAELLECNEDDRLAIFRDHLQKSVPGLQISKQQAKNLIAISLVCVKGRIQGASSHKKFASETLLITSDDSLPLLEVYPKLDWDSYVEGDIKLLHLPSNHQKMLESPMVEKLAEYILNNVNQENSNE